jgi:uncharacterized protein DUF5666
MRQRRISTLTATAAAVLLSGAAAARGAQSAWSGSVAAVQGDDLALVGVPAHFRMAGSATEVATGRSVSAPALAPGTSVTLRVGEREADGRFRADRVEIRAKNPLSVAGTVGRVADDRRHVEVEGVEIELDRSTGFSGRTASGSLRSARDLAAGMSVSVALVPTTSGTLRAAEVRPAASSSEAGEDREIRGIVQAIGDASWTIDGTALGITDQTVFEGDPALGDLVEAKFHADASGSLVADRIEKEDAADAAESEFRGIVEAIGAASWTISGQVVGVDASTQILGAPVVGDEVEVHANKAADGSLTATRIQKENETGDDQGGNASGNDDGTNHDDNGGTTAGNGADDGSNHDANDDNGGTTPAPTSGGSHHGRGGDNSGSDD